MANARIESILSDLNSGKIDMSTAAKLLHGTRKLRGVKVSAEDMAAYAAFVDTGDFRALCDTTKLKTNEAQALLGRCARATYEKLSD